MKMSKKQFNELLQDPANRVAPVPGKADWDAILKALRKTGEPLNIATIQEEYVKGVVVKYRTKNVLQRWAAQGKCKMIWWKGQYWFLFEDPDKKPRRTRKTKEPKGPEGLKAPESPK